MAEVIRYCSRKRFPETSGIRCDSYQPIGPAFGDKQLIDVGDGKRDCVATNCEFYKRWQEFILLRLVIQFPVSVSK